MFIVKYETSILLKYVESTLNYLVQITTKNGIFDQENKYCKAQEKLLSI